MVILLCATGSKNEFRSVADPGFPEVRAPTLQGAPTYDFAKISQKLHEIERIWTPVRRPSRPP